MTQATNGAATRRNLKLSRRDLEKMPLQMLHPARNWSKADVLAGEIETPAGLTRFIVKDLKSRALWYRLLAGRTFLRREWRALKALDGVEGVPRALARPDLDSLVIEYVEGTAVADMPYGSMPEDVFLRIEALVEKLHARGVTHGDLHQDNILVKPDGDVALIDWATAQSVGAHPKGVKQWAFDEWRALDLRSVYKLKVFHAKHLLTRKEHEFLKNGGSRMYGAIKKVRRGLDKLRGKKSSGVFEASLESVEQWLGKSDELKAEMDRGKAAATTEPN